MRIFILLSVLSSPSLSASETDTFHKYLPATAVDGEFVSIAGDPVLEPLLQKMQASIAKNSSWFQQALSKLKPGEPLPYDERLGITNADYIRVQKSQSNPGGFTLNSIATGKLIRKKDGFEVSGTKGSKLGFVVKESPSGEIRGFFEKPFTVDKFDNPKAPGGGMKGWSFKVEESQDINPSTLTGFTSNLVVAEFYNKKDCFVSMTAKQFKKGIPLLNKDVMFKYPCPK